MGEINIGDEIVYGTKEVFTTMLMTELEAGDIVNNSRCDISSNLTSMIGLGGDIRGVLAIHTPASVAKNITSAFLGMEVDDLGDDVKDAIGEIANMVAGNLKVSYAKSDRNIVLAIPTSIVGDSFSVSGISDATRIVVPLKMSGETFWVELMYVYNS